MTTNGSSALISKQHIAMVGPLSLKLRKQDCKKLGYFITLQLYVIGALGFQLNMPIDTFGGT
jgi:hypothetical protein